MCRGNCRCTIIDIVDILSPFLPLTILVKKWLNADHIHLNLTCFKTSFALRVGDMLRLGIALSILAIAAAVNVGDELYSGDSDGRFYVLADKVSARACLRASGTECLP